MVSTDDGSGQGSSGRGSGNSPDSGSLPHVGPGDVGRPEWWEGHADEDEERRTSRVADQVQIVVDRLGGPDVVHVAEAGGERIRQREQYGDLAYMYRRGHILVRDGDLSRVLEALRGSGGQAGAAVREGGVNGLTLLEVDSAEQALAVLDSALGARVGFPDHALYVTRLIGSACPATEPLPTQLTTPDPGRAVHDDCNGQGVAVAVVDTGFDAETAGRTPWLSGVSGEQEVVDPTDLGPYVGHGTFVAGVVRTMAPQAEVSVDSYLPHGGAIFESDIARQLQDAILRTPDIITMSAGTRSRANQGLLSFSVLWEQLLPKGTVLIAAAGNDGSRDPFYPAAARYAVSVGAVDAHGQRAPYSNHGSWVDVYARGSDVVNAFPDGSYEYREPPRVGRRAQFSTGLATWSGTSFATPMVAGLVAARMTWSGENGHRAAKALRKIARKHAKVGVGPVLEPWMACRR